MLNKGNLVYIVGSNPTFSAFFLIKVLKIFSFDEIGKHVGFKIQAFLGY